MPVGCAASLLGLGCWVAMSKVNDLLTSLMKYGLHLDIRLVDIKPLERDLWDSSVLLPGPGKPRLPVNKAIDLFYDWSWRDRANLPRFDHALLVTGFDVVDPANVSRPTTGVAYKGVMCKFGSISLIENIFTFQMVHDLAHELGHSLGCDHDSETSECSDLDGYIMAGRPDLNSTNRWSFSKCSARDIINDLQELENHEANCLSTTTEERAVAPPLGALYNADTQCRLLFQDDAYFCRDFYSSSADYSQMCSSFWCSPSVNSSRCISHISSEGFLCGDQKVCVRGDCVRLETAPPAMPSCPQGDQPGKVKDDLTCAGVAESQPWLCYDEFYRKRCCMSCHGISREDIEGCKYGDKQAWCQGSEIEYPFDCYLHNQTCCASCAEYKDEAKKGCEFGDRSAECSSSMTLPLGCYWNEELCCDTCTQHKNTSNAGCEYGDRSTWCAEKMEVPSGCYLNQQLCCATCQEEKQTDKPDCPFGDRYPKWCPTVTPHGCYNETVRQWCCDTCQASQNGTNTGCEYGNKYKNCDDLIYPYACYHPTNEKACCELCSVYKNDSRDDCKFGDKQAWCWKLSLTYEETEWCPLDAENDHCCGTCRHNKSDVPVFGYRLREEGLAQVTILGNSFKDDVREEVRRKKEEQEEAKRKAEEEEEKKKNGSEGTDNTAGDSEGPVVAGGSNVTSLVAPGNGTTQERADPAPGNGTTSGSESEVLDSGTEG